MGIEHTNMIGQKIFQTKFLLHTFSVYILYIYYIIILYYIYVPIYILFFVKNANILYMSRI